VKRRIVFVNWAKFQDANRLGGVGEGLCIHEKSWMEEESLLELLGPWVIAKGAYESGLKIILRKSSVWKSLLVISKAFPFKLAEYGLN